MKPSKSIRDWLKRRKMMKNKNQIAYTMKKMTKEQFYKAYHWLARNEESHVLLESGRDGRYSIAGVNPLAKIQGWKENELQIIWRDGTKEKHQGDLLENLEKFNDSFHIEKTENLPPFQGGVLGFISYDYVRHFETLPNRTKEFATTPDLYFYLFDEWVVLDIEKEMAYFMALPKRDIDIDEVAEKWLTAARTKKQVLFSDENVEVSTEDLQVSVTGPQFEQMVRDVQAYIAQGDVTQVNLSLRQSKEMTTSSLELYEALRQVNPSPYMASMGAKEFSVVSSSPELLVKKRGNVIETRPIGGTRKRGITKAEDQANEQDLITDEKEKNEHLMLVELEKEDFERVCVPGTVEADELMVVERYSHVMHLVSNIRGTIPDNVSNATIVKAVFPGGTITGAPKLRTMEIIEELEPEKRGLYTGSIGWFGFNGDFELNIVIRTAFVQNGLVHIQAGAGLVADSIPREEYVESIAKGAALWKAKAVAERYKKEE